MSSTTTQRASTPQAQASMPMEPAPLSDDINPSSSPSSPQAMFDKVFSGADQRPVVLFDGICGFCNRGIDTTMALDRNRRLRWLDSGPLLALPFPLLQAVSSSAVGLVGCKVHVKQHDRPSNASYPPWAP